jgi:predicted ATPase
MLEPVVRAHDNPQRLLRGAELAGELLLRAPGREHETTLSASEDAVFGLLHALYWLVVNLSDEAPVLILVDDYQWADEPSQRSLGFCATRLAEVPVGVVLTNASRVSSTNSYRKLGVPGRSQLRAALGPQH